MNELYIFNDVKTMSSREIADMCEKQHHNVLATITFLRKENALDGQEREYKTSQGNKYKEWLFDKNNSLILVARLEPRFMSAIILRWQELEKPKELSRMDLIKIAYESEKENIELRKVVQEQTPKVEALERLTKLEGSVTITNAAKNINVSPRDLFDWLSRKEWIYKRNDIYGKKTGDWLAYQDKIKSGYLELKPVKIIQEFGKNTIKEQTLVTPKGLAKLAQIVNFSTDSY